MAALVNVRSPVAALVKSLAICLPGSLGQCRILGVTSSLAMVMKCCHVSNCVLLPTSEISTVEGNLSPCSLAQIVKARPICLWLFRHAMRCAFDLDLASAG